MNTLLLAQALVAPGVARAVKVRCFAVQAGWGVMIAIAVLGSWSRAQAPVQSRPMTPGGRIRPMWTYEIRSLEVDARIRDQAAEVRSTQTYHNPGSFEIEAELLFPLPEDATVSNFVLLVDGKELPGRLLDQREARRVYEEIVRRRRDPGLLEFLGRGLYRASVFPIPPHADRKVVMRYTQILKRQDDTIEFVYPFAHVRQASRPIEHLSIQVDVEDRSELRTIYAPRDEVEVERDGSHRARVSFEEQDATPRHDFHLVIGLGEQAVAGTVLSYRPSADEDGYFLVLASPRLERPDVPVASKTVIFVLDRSGSMAGGKLKQAKSALRRAIEDLHEDDLFNLVVFDDAVETYRSELVRANAPSRQAALKYLERVSEGGGTNIGDALIAALGLIPRNDDRPCSIVFLTDGAPTTGETRELAIARLVREANRTRARIFCFGVGFDVNARLLDRLSGGHRGVTEYVRPEEPIERKVGRFLARMSCPALSDIKIELEGVTVRRAYPRDLPDLFAGGELAWVGRYETSGKTRIRIVGKIGSEHHTYLFPARLAGPGESVGRSYLARIWAARRIGDLIDEIDLNGRKDELVHELVSLSKRYGILTPYTAFLADEGVPLPAVPAQAARAGEGLDALQAFSGRDAFNQRALKQRMLAALQEPNSGLAAPEMEELADLPGPGLRPRSKVDRGPSGGQSGKSQHNGGMMGAGPAGRPAQAPPVRQRIRNLGNRTLFWKHDHWIESTLTEAEAKSPKVIVQLSDEYFTLAQSLGPEDAPALALAEPTLVRIQGVVYRIEPPRGEP